MGIVHHRWNLCCDYDWPSSGRIRNIPYASSPRATCPLTGRTAPTLIVCRGLCPSSRRRFLVSQTPQKANTQHTHGQHESTSPPAVANHTYTRRPVRRKTRRKAAAPPSPGAEAPSRRAAQPGPSCRGTYQFQAWAASPYSCAGGGRGGGGVTSLPHARQFARPPLACTLPPPQHSHPDQRATASPCSPPCLLLHRIPRGGPPPATLFPARPPSAAPAAAAAQPPPPPNSLAAHGSLGREQLSPSRRPRPHHHSIFNPSTRMARHGPAALPLLPKHIPARARARARAAPHPLDLIAPHASLPRLLGF